MERLLRIGVGRCVAALVVVLLVVARCVSFEAIPSHISGERLDRNSGVLKQPESNFHVSELGKYIRSQSSDEGLPLDWPSSPLLVLAEKVLDEVIIDLANCKC